MKMLWYLGPLMVVLFARIPLDGASQAETADNTLTRAEKDAGWLLLFNGKNLDGWQTSSKQPSKIPSKTGPSTLTAAAVT